MHSISLSLESLRKTDPYNVRKWHELISIYEDTATHLEIVEIYESYLKLFPLDSSIMIKLAAKHYEENGDCSMVSSLYRKYLSPQLLQFSVSTWETYCEFIFERRDALPRSFIKQEFEEALHCVGSFYKSDNIWSMYLSFLADGDDIKTMISAYTRLLNHPLRNIDLFWSNFTVLLHEHGTISPDLFLTSTDIEVDAINPRLASFPDETSMFKYYQSMKDQSIRRAEEIGSFEQKLVSENFNGEPMPISQQITWNSYINHVISCGYINEATKLYERNILANPLNPDVWMSYANFILSNHGMTHAIQLLERADKSALSVNPDYQRYTARFYEINNETQRSEQKYMNLVSFPHSAEARIAYAQYLIRLNRKDEAYSSLVECISDDLDSESYTRICYCIYQLEKPFDVDHMLKRCSSAPLSLSLAVKIFLDKKDTEAATNAYEYYLFSPNSEAALDDRAKVISVYINHLKAFNYSEQKIERIMKFRKEIIKDANLQDIRPNRDQTQDPLSLASILEKWSTFISDTSYLVEDFEKSNEPVSFIR